MCPPSLSNPPSRQDPLRRSRAIRPAGRDARNGGAIISGDAVDAFRLTQGYWEAKVIGRRLSQRPSVYRAADRQGDQRQPGNRGDCGRLPELGIDVDADSVAADLE